MVLAKTEEEWSRRASAFLKAELKKADVIGRYLTGQGALQFKPLREVRP
jgi:hypothetical protein